MVEIDKVTSEKELALCLEIRRIVFIEEQKVPEHEEVDGDDAHCTHLLLRVDGKPVGAARFQYIGEKAKIQRVCILKAMRGQRLGEALMLKILDVIKSEGKSRLAVLGAQTHALQFYENLGFWAFGEEYLDAGIKHRDMMINL
jgi:ElaA protein